MSVAIKAHETLKVEWENIFHGILFIVLSIFFYYFVNSILFTIHPKLFIGFLISSLSLIPFSIFFFSKRYWTFIIGYFIPSIIHTSYFIFEGAGKFALVFPLFKPLSVIPIFIFLYFLRKTEEIKKEIVIIFVFVVLMSFFSLLPNWVIIPKSLEFLLENKIYILYIFQYIIIGWAYLCSILLIKKNFYKIKVKI